MNADASVKTIFVEKLNCCRYSETLVTLIPIYPISKRGLFPMIMLRYSIRNDVFAIAMECNNA